MSTPFKAFPDFKLRSYVTSSGLESKKVQDARDSVKNDLTK